MGGRRIGIALSDTTRTIARGLEVIHLDSKTDLIEYFRKIIRNYDVSIIVLGLPRNMDGTLGEQAQKVMDFGNKLKEVFPDTKIDYLDERLSTVQATKALIEADMTRAKRKKVIDKVSAVIILQNYLDINKGKNLC